MDGQKALGLREAGAGRGRQRWRQSRGQAKQRRRGRARALKRVDAAGEAMAGMAWTRPEVGEGAADGARTRT